MFFLSTPDHGRVEREAKRRLRNRAIKRRKAIIRTVVLIFSMTVLGVSLWTVRRILSAKYLRGGMFSNNFNPIQRSSTPSEMHENEERTTDEKSDTSERSGSPTRSTHNSTQGQLPSASDIGEKASVINNVLSIASEDSSERQPVTAVSRREESQVSISESSNASPKNRAAVPGILPPDVDPSLPDENKGAVNHFENHDLRYRRQKGNIDDSPMTWKKTEKEPEADVRRNAAEKEKPDGGETDEGGGEGEDDETKEDDIQGGGDSFTDSIDEEEGGRAPIITLPNKKEAKDSDEDGSEDMEQEEENDGGDENVE